MEKKDIRWMQRFSNYQKAFFQLSDAVALLNQRELSKLEKQGLIQCFEYTHELAWNTLKDLLEFKGNERIYGSRDAVRAAFKLELIVNGETWMEMINSRNQTSHTYDENVANKIVLEISKKYMSEFADLQTKLGNIQAEEVSIL